MEQLIIFSKKYGVTGLLVVWLWWTNERLDKVENELYICYQNSYNNKNSNNETSKDNLNFAILPKKIKYVSAKMAG